MKKPFFLIVFAMALLISCHRYDVGAFGDGVLRDREWLSFDVDRSTYLKGKCVGKRQAHVIINNVNDTIQNIAIFEENGDAIYVTADTMIHIDPNHQWIVRLTKEVDYYDDVVGQTLTTTMLYLPFHYLCYNPFFYTFDEVLGRTLRGTDTIYLIKGTQTIPVCYTDGTCRLEETHVKYTYNARLKTITEASVSFGIGKEKVKTVMSNLRFEDRSALIDSVFNLKSNRNTRYEQLPINEYYPHCTQYTTNTEINDTVLDFPLVNVLLGDTLHIRDLNGGTMLYFYNFNLNRDVYQMVENESREVENLIWIMPDCDNADGLKELVAREHLGKNLYHAKGFSRHILIDNRHQAYWLGYNHHTESVYDRRESFTEWIEHLKIEKPEKINKSNSAIQFLQTVHDFDTIDKGENGDCRFEFKNTGREPLIISSVSASCGCTSTEIVKGVVMPEDTGSISIHYNTSNIGAFYKTIVVKSNAANSPTSVLRIKGFVREKPKSQTK